MGVIVMAVRRMRVVEWALLASLATVWGGLFIDEHPGWTAYAGLA